MGSLSDNGGGVPPDGGTPDGLPGLPPEWGDIVIPDDLAELADEAAAIRAELRRGAPDTRWQRFAHRPAVHRLRRVGAAALRPPVLIISLAVLVTVASLFAAAWPGPVRVPTTQRTAGTSSVGGTLPALELVGVDGQTVSLLSELPAVILLIDGCDCAQFVSAVAAAVRPEIAIVTVVSGTAPVVSTPPTGAAPPAQAKPVRQLRDPTGTLRSTYDIGAPDGAAVALLVDRTGAIVRTVPGTVSVEDFRPDLTRL